MMELSITLRTSCSQWHAPAMRQYLQGIITMATILFHTPLSRLYSMCLRVAPYYFTLSLKVSSVPALHEDCPCFLPFLLSQYPVLSLSLTLHCVHVLSSLFTRHFWYDTVFISQDEQLQRASFQQAPLGVQQQSWPEDVLRLTQSSKSTSSCSRPAKILSARNKAF